MLLDYLGIVVMALLGGARLNQIFAGEWWALPLFIHAMLSALLLVLHRKTKRQSPLLQRLVAWASALLPFAIQMNTAVPTFIRALSLLGVAVAIWTIATLGKAFDVSPADRGFGQQGPLQMAAPSHVCQRVVLRAGHGGDGAVPAQYSGHAAADSFVDHAYLLGRKDHWWLFGIQPASPQSFYYRGCGDVQ